MMTPWGYEVDGELPPLVEFADFDAMTGGRWSGDMRALSAIAAASQAIRNHCGWHVSPSMPCKARITAEGRMARVPAAYVSEYASVKERDPRTGQWNGLALPGEVETRHDGLLRRIGTRFAPAWDGIEVEYTAGYDCCSVPDLANAVVGIAEAVLMMPRGVASESADGVAVTYTASAQSIANSMTQAQRSALAPYKVVGSHAA